MKYLEELVISLLVAAFLMMCLLCATEHSITTELKHDAIARGFATWEIDREDGRQVFTWKEQDDGSYLEPFDNCTHGPRQQQWKEPAR